MENEKLNKVFIKIRYTNKDITIKKEYIRYIPYIYGNIDNGK